VNTETATTKSDKKRRGSTLGIYFPGLSKEQANEMRTRLNALAAEWGYLAERGETAGQGAAGRLLMALARGELRLAKGEVGESTGDEQGEP
jgi:hypothetical protein